MATVEPETTPATPTTPTAAIPPLIPKPETMLITTPLKPLPSPTKTVFPAPPPSTVVGNWILFEHRFAPKRDHFMAYCKFLSRRRITDHLMWFRFPNAPENTRESVHYSRLAFVGGPLAELLGEDAEGERADVDMMKVGEGKKVVTDVPDSEHPYERKEDVVLGKLDTKRTFAIVIQFLYCEEIQFNYLTFDEVVALATCAHRWGLVDLYHATFAYVMDQNLLAGGYGIRTFIPLVRHEETPESFRRYFCIAVGHHFEVLYPRMKAVQKALGGEKGPTPPLWEVVIKQGMLSHIIHCISLYSNANYDEYLIDVVLSYYEPTCKDDDDVLGLLSQLNWDDIDPMNVFSQTGASRRWSARGIRLAAMASYAPQTEALEVRIPWNIPLQKLLKNETWSFQTEHVPAGPYICYLHVRKGQGPEVSVFVHIWNRDQKPIGDDARHESVRVMCRATERNCNCDSSKQWSDSSHGFLENLKFEGRLERYPGLGWSQFLEEKRLEEWKACHGDDCGLAITTVLQFIKPRKQFEGPARRSTRGSSPAALQSPIQKKRSGGSRMKLRETR